MKTSFTQRKFYIVYAILVIALFIGRKSFAQCGTTGGNGAILTANNIVIDGTMTDWTSYLNDPDNNTYDGNPDYDSATVSDPGRDLSRFVMTQSGTGLYMYFSRVAGNNNSIDFLVYLDINNNKKVDLREPVIDLSWSGANGKGMVKVFNYTPFNAAGDSIAKNGNMDGYSMPGSLGSTPRVTIGYNGQGSADGASLEVYVPWSYLTQTDVSGNVIYSLAYASPFLFHISSLNGTPSSVPGANSINDNFGGCFGGTVQDGKSLPIKLSYFSARTENNTRVILNWVTEMELNNDYYTIERSEDGRNFKAIAMVMGALTTTMQQSYEYKDNLAGVDKSKTIYYRIKQTDIDGSSSYTPVRSVKLNQKQLMIQVNPNPIVDNVTVKFVSETSGKMDVRMVNSNGQTVLNRTFSVNKGYNGLTLNNLASLPKGLYIVQVMINGEVSEKTKLIKQ